MERIGNFYRHKGILPEQFGVLVRGGVTLIDARIHTEDQAKALIPEAVTGYKFTKGWRSSAMTDCKIIGTSDSGRTTYTGYLNTKGVADSYGDIPTSYKGNPVYDLSRMMLNPVVLCDHQNSTGMIMGRFVDMIENERGLGVTFELISESEAKNPIVAHAVKMWEIGMARALSMGGEWRFEDPMNPAHLTKAIIHEGSCVAVGADQYALACGKPQSGKDNQ